MSVPTASLTDRTTWAKRNALQKIQPTRERAWKLTDAEKASRKLAAGLKRQKQTQLNDAVAAYILERTTKLQELADNHSVKVTKIEDMVNAATHYKKSRTPSLANAIVHYLSKMVNEGQSCIFTPIYMHSPYRIYQIYLWERENPLLSLNKWHRTIRNYSPRASVNSASKSSSTTLLKLEKKSKPMLVVATGQLLVMSRPRSTG
jgi:hypothetical protein